MKMVWKAYYIDKMNVATFDELEYEGDYIGAKPFRVETVDNINDFLKEFEGDSDAYLIFRSDDLIIIELDENITTTIIILKKES